MRIVHFSDIHLACRPRSASFLFDKRILGSLNFQLRRRSVFKPERLSQALLRIKLLTPDWVICTGDVTCVGSPAETEASVTRLKSLLDHVPGHFLFVPGNHDAYVRNRACRAGLEAAFEQFNGGRWRLSDLPQELRVKGLRFFVVDESRPTNWLLSAFMTTRFSIPAWE